MGSQFYASRDRPSLVRSNNHRQHFRRWPLGGFTGGQSSGPSEGSFHLKSSFDCRILNRSPKTFKFGMCSTFHLYFELTCWKFWFRKNLFTKVVWILIFTKMAKWRSAANFSECCLWSDPFSRSIEQHIWASQWHFLISEKYKQKLVSIGRVSHLAYIAPSDW